MRCNACGCEKSPEEFPRNRRMKSGRGSYCKPCHNKRNRDCVLRKHGGYRHYRLRDRYGIGAEEVEALKAAQGGLCAVCRRSEATQVDHDHKTGKVRGILCLACNAGMGAFRDDPRLIYMAIDYLSPDSLEDLVL